MTILAVFGFAAAQFLMGFSTSLTQLIIFASLQEAMGGFYPAAVSLTASNTPKEKTAQALGILQFANGSGNVVGPILGGVLADLVGLREVFFLIAITVGLSGFLIVFFIDENNFTREDHNYYFLTKNWRYVFDNKKLIICMLFLLIYSLAVTVVRPTFSLFIKSMNFALNNPSTITGIMLGIFGGTSALSSALVGKFTVKRKINSILIMASIVVTATYFLLSFASTIPFLIIVLAIGGFGLGLIQPLVFTLVSHNTDINRKAGVFGVGSSFQVIGNLFGSVSAGYIVYQFGLSFPFIAAGILFLLVIFVASFGIKKNLL